MTTDSGAVGGEAVEAMPRGLASPAVAGLPAAGSPPSPPTCRVEGRGRRPVRDHCWRWPLSEHGREIAARPASPLPPLSTCAPGARPSHGETGPGSGAAGSVGAGRRVARCRERSAGGSGTGRGVRCGSRVTVRNWSAARTWYRAAPRWPQRPRLGLQRTRCAGPLAAASVRAVVAATASRDASRRFAGRRRAAAGWPVRTPCRCRSADTSPTGRLTGKTVVAVTVLSLPLPVQRRGWSEPRPRELVLPRRLLLRRRCW